MSKGKLLFIIYGLMISWALSLHQYILFLRAYGDPAKAIILYINVFGEATGELYLLTFSMIVGTLATFYVLWCIRKNQNII